jgi:hypothetical protein
VQAIATIPEFLWELSLGIYPIVRGFKASPILETGLPASGGARFFEPRRGFEEIVGTC